MSFINPFLDKDEGKTQRNSQKFSLMFIEQGFFHRMEIKSIDSLHKLKIRLKKPVILSIYTLDVIRHIINHSDVINSILQIDNLYQLKLSVPGYGIFSQNYELQQISKLFSILGQYCLTAKVTLKKITLEMPGWHTFSIQIIQNFFRFISQCEILEEFSLNLNLAYKKPILLEQSQIPERQKEQLRFYGTRAFNIQSFEKLLFCLTTFLPVNFLTKLDLRFGAWESVGDDMLISFTEFMQQLYGRYHNLKVVKIDLHGWGVGEYDNQEDKMTKEEADNFFKAIEQIQSSTSQILQLDMRFWPSIFGVKKQKQRFQYLNGLKRKQDGIHGNAQTPWNMTGTTFFGSQLRSKLLMKLKIQIKD